MTVTYHLTPRAWWEAADPVAPLGAPSLETEGFVHCTDGADAMVATANRHYATDPRPFVILAVELDLISSPWRAEDPARIYPHIFGPIDRSAILAVTDAPREEGGSFLPFGT